jgi:dihydroorotase-like cyclic amidohydrolase
MERVRPCIGNEDLKTKAGWTPFAGMKVVGKVVQVDLRGATAYKSRQGAGRSPAAAGS